MGARRDEPGASQEAVREVHRKLGRRVRRVPVRLLSRRKIRQERHAGAYEERFREGVLPEDCVARGGDVRHGAGLPSRRRPERERPAVLPGGGDAQDGGRRGARGAVCRIPQGRYGRNVCQDGRREGARLARREGLDRNREPRGI